MDTNIRHKKTGFFFFFDWNWTVRGIEKGFNEEKTKKILRRPKKKQNKIVKRYGING